MVLAFAARCALRIQPMAAAPHGRLPEGWNARIAAVPFHCCILAIARAAQGMTETEGSLEFGGAQELRNTANAAAKSVGEEASVVAAVSADVATLAIDSANDKVDFSRWIERVISVVTQVENSLRNVGRTRPAAEIGAAIEADLSWFESAESTNNVRTIRSFFERPLWGVSHGETEKQAEVWSRALFALASDHVRDARTRSIIEVFGGIANGRPDWSAILRGPASHEPTLETPVKPDSPITAPGILPPQDVATLLARLAYASTSDLSLAEAPTLEALSSALERRKRTPNQLAECAVELTKAVPDFTPDPVWLAWVQIAFPRFFADIPGWQQRSATAGRPRQASFSKKGQSWTANEAGEFVPDEPRPAKASPSPTTGGFESHRTPMERPPAKSGLPPPENPPESPTPRKSADFPQEE